MKVGFFSPRPPAPTGVADYSAALMEALGKFCDVRVADPDSDVCLYHLGNNPLHADIYRQALAAPGVIVLHDAVLHHFFLGLLDRESYIEEFVYNYGESERGLAEQLWEERGRSAQDARYFDRAMVRRIAGISRAVVVHNQEAAAIVLRHASEACVVEIPHLVGQTPWCARVPPDPLPAGQFRFGVFGHLRESKRIATILRAFERVRASHAGISLVVAGDFVSRDYEAALAPMLAAPGVIRFPWAPETEFWQLAAGVDACISLRDPSAGETSGITIRFMGIGKTVLVSAGDEVARFPENCVIRIDRGLAEEAMLVDYMMWLVEHPEKAREIGARAAAHVAERHSRQFVARRYFELLSSCCR